MAKRLPEIVRNYQGSNAAIASNAIPETVLKKDGMREPCGDCAIFVLPV
jgi:hypothetical protein